MLVWWGTARVGELALNPDRAADVDVFYTLATGDVDGDGRMDILGARGRISLSGANKDTRQRPFTPDDVDATLVGVYYTQVLGPINDSTGRFDAVGASQYINPSARDRMAAFSGSPSGPDVEYDGYWTPALEGAATNLAENFKPAGDVNGDGWPDALFSSYVWGTYDMGYAAVILGGPYVPRDFVYASSPSYSAGRVGGIRIIPNPTSGTATLTWQTGSGTHAASIDLTDALGRLTYTAPVAPGDRTHRVDCSRLAPGAYFVMLRDQHGQPLISASLLMQ